MPPSIGSMPEKSLKGMQHLNREISATSHRRLEGKVGVVTGGAHGIGEAIVRLFIRHGAKVVIADIDDASGKLLAFSLGPSATFIHCDVTEESDIEQLIERTLSRHGRVDVFCNNAGVLGRQSRRTSKSIIDLDVDDLDRVLRVNVRGTALGMKHAARAMIPRRSGCIISTASVAGVRGGMGPHGYTASKHAVVGLTRNVACELGKNGIRVNCISPFGVATSMMINAWRDCDNDDDEMIDAEVVMIKPSEEEIEKTEEFVRGLADLKGYTLKAKDIAEAALFLASDESKYVSGHNLVVDGGVTTSRNLIGL